MRKRSHWAFIILWLHPLQITVYYACSSDNTMLRRVFWLVPDVNDAPPCAGGRPSATMSPDLVLVGAPGARSTPRSTCLMPCLPASAVASCRGPPHQPHDAMNATSPCAAVCGFTSSQATATHASCTRCQKCRCPQSRHINHTHHCAHSRLTLHASHLRSITSQPLTQQLPRWSAPAASGGAA